MHFVDFDVDFSDSYQVLQHSILFRASSLLLVSFSDTCQIFGMWLYFDFRSFRYDTGAFLHKLHEDEIFWKKPIVLHGSFWLFSYFALLYHALHLKVRNEIKNKRVIKLKRLLTKCTMIFIFLFFTISFIQIESK